MIDYLENKTGLKIEKLNYNFVDTIFIGVTPNTNEKKAFIKVCMSEKKLKKEVFLSNILNRNVIDVDNKLDKHIFAVDYFNFKPINKVNDNYIKKFAKSICEIHSYDISSIPEFIEEFSLYELLEYFYNEINKEEQEELKWVYQYFINSKDNLEKEENNLNKQLLHGDFCVGNSAYIEDDVFLFDFENCFIQTPWYDIIKCFTLRLCLEIEQKSFLDEYNKHLELQPISSELYSLIQFIVLMDIKTTLSKFEKTLATKNNLYMIKSRLIKSFSI